jgi:hypothetical protein
VLDHRSLASMRDLAEVDTELTYYI